MGLGGLMETFGKGLVDVARDQVDVAVARYAKMATVIGRDSTGPLAQVSFYGSDGGVSDVKCPESVVVAPGDLVGLVKYEHDWIITVNYTGRTLADAVSPTPAPWASLQQTTTGTFVDMPNSPSVEWTKARDLTVMRFAVQASASGSNLANIIELALHVISDDGVTDYVETIAHMKTTNGGEHDHFTGLVQAASAHPAGGYAAVVQWRRTSGTGFIQVDADDRMFIQVREVWP
jgi:hypothetical protein